MEVMFQFYFFKYTEKNLTSTFIIASQENCVLYSYFLQGVFVRRKMNVILKLYCRYTYSAVMVGFICYFLENS